MYVQTEITPNPNSLKFIPGKIVSNSGSFEITNKEEINNELVRNILSVSGVKGIFLGSDFLIKGAVGIAVQFSIPKEVIGLTILAFGTSLPELITSLIAAYRRHSDIVIGNILGSNIFNLLGRAQLSRIDGSVYTLRYDSDNCRMFLFFNEKNKSKSVEYFEIRNKKAELLNSRKKLEDCYKEFDLLN